MVNKEKRNIYLNSLINRNTHMLESIDSKVQKLLLSILYLGEGAKYKSTKSLMLANSNPNIIRLFLKLLKNCYNIDDSKFRVRIQCRYDQNTELIEDYWRDITKINRKQFYPTYVDKRTKGKPTKKKEYRGVCSVQYFSTEIQLELEFLAEAIISKILRAVSSIG